ncbi:hypothetical protein [Enterococcus faecium]|uniref:hypothetical protein n=1 Tax=Enterococcus faecium TaxID=1352 RepID=UPI00338EA6D0
MLDDRLTCSNCGTLFYYEEVRNIVKHRKKEMPIRCPNCNEVIKRKLSHGYFVSYELYEESKINLKKKPKYYKNLKTGAIITEKEFKNLVTEEESRFYNLSGNICPGSMDQIIENESIESIENYVPVDLPK